MIKKIEKSDYDRLMQLNEESGAYTNSIETFIEECIRGYESDQEAKIFAIADTDKFVGILGLYPICNKMYELNIWLAPRYRNIGIATITLKEVIEQFGSDYTLIANVCKSNKVSLKLFKDYKYIDNGIIIQFILNEK